MTNYKFSEKAFFEAIANSPVALTIADTDYSADEVKDFALARLSSISLARLSAISAQYAKRSAKRAEKKEDENATIKAHILDVLSTEPVSIATISATIADSVGVTYSVQKLSPILKGMADNGTITRTVGKDKRVAYSA